ncbi:MAG: hypothetical protein ABFC67_14520 [Mizugakiibacter sp.]|uniref:portal protein n=1 Tax=Mizugakiibacter sp. TaxID=1972610 RepID=UPI00320C4CED
MADTNNTGVQELALAEWQQYLGEIREQPPWRREADVIADYYDGNQLDSETLRAMEELGMAPIIENLMAPAIDSVLGMEAKNRRDWRVTGQGNGQPPDVAEGMNQKINEAEREAKADRACSDAFASQAKVGLGCVGVGLNHDPFKYPHQVEAVHRNEVFWDWKAKPDLSDARYFIRQRWHDLDVLQLAFPDKADLIQHSGTGWATTDLELLMDGGQSTGLAREYSTEQQFGSGLTGNGYTMLEMEWRELYRKRLCLSEVWYRRWVRGKVLKSPDGRVVEYDPKNPLHVAAVQSGMLRPQDALYSKVRLSWWIGPHKLADIPNPYKHGKIPYVLFFGKREDLTGIPYGLGRPMKPLQDEINARNTKMQWLLVAKRITMTKGVTDPDQARNEASRPDAVHVLDPEKLRNGGMFKVESDFSLEQQQYNALVDKREALKNVAGIYKAFEGNNSNATSGLAINSLVEQSTQTLAEIMDNFTFGRAEVGDMLLSNLIQEIGEQEVEVEVKRDFAQAKTVVINQRAVDEAGNEVLNNDLQRARLKVALTDVPSTQSYRQQRLMMLTEITKSLPPNLQALVIDFVIASTDIPERDAIVERLRKALNLGGDQPPRTPEEAAAQQQAKEQAAAADALQQRVADLEIREREAKVEKMLAEVEKLLRDARNPVQREVALINADSAANAAAVSHAAAESQAITAAALQHLAEERAEEETAEQSGATQPSSSAPAPQQGGGLPMPSGQDEEAAEQVDNAQEEADEQTVAPAVPTGAMPAQNVLQPERGS